MTGATDSTDFPTTAGAFDTTYNGLGDAFVTKLDASGAALVYSTYLGGSGIDGGHGIAVDGAGSAYVTGYTQLGGLPDDRGRLRHDLQRRHDDAFVTKLNASGAALGYSTYLGGSDYDLGQGIAVDGAGSAYVTGYTRSADFPTTAGAFDTTYNGGGDAFVTKLERERRRPRLLHLPGRKRLRPRRTAIAVDGAGSAYVTGTTRLGGLPDDRGRLRHDLQRRHDDAFVTKLDASGAALGYSTFLGGSWTTTTASASRSTAPAAPT